VLNWVRCIRVAGLASAIMLAASCVMEQASADACVTIPPALPEKPTGSLTARPCAAPSQVTPSYLAAQGLQITPTSGIPQGAFDPTLNDQAPWIAGPSIAPPLTVDANDTKLALKTSLNQVRDYNQQLTAQKLATAPKASGLVVPKAALPQTSLDVWTSVGVDGLDQAQHPALRTGIGADYHVDKTAKFGVRAQVNEQSTSGSTPGSHTKTLAAAVTLNPAAKWRLGVDTQLTQEGTDQTSATSKIDKTAIVVAPRLARTFAVDGGATVEPFVTLKREMPLTLRTDDVTPKSSAATQSGGVGMTLTKPDTYSLSMTTNFDGLLSLKDPPISSRLDLKIPLR
jgi:hypothetical protein